jgi:hypothetical protein
MATKKGNEISDNARWNIAYLQKIQDFDWRYLKTWFIENI